MMNRRIKNYSNYKYISYIVKILNIMYFTCILKETLSVISSDPSYGKDGNALFTTVLFKALSDQV